MKTIYLVSLKWDNYFKDADDGWCFAATCLKPLRSFVDRQPAEDLVAKWNQPLAEAEKDKIVFPVQPASKKVKDGLGITPHEIDSDGENFCLVIEEIDLFD